MPYLLLILALCIAFYASFIPKQGYPYPLHVDEWAHLDQAQNVIELKGLSYPPHRESGFHLFLAEVQLVTGLDWFTIFRWLPSILFVITVFFMYLVGQKFGCGVEAAFLTALVPTTIRTLGPSFLVPVSIGMLAVPLCLFHLLEARVDKKHYIIIVIVLMFVWISHPVSALILTGVVVLFEIMALRFGGDITSKKSLQSISIFFISVGALLSLVVWIQFDLIKHGIESLANPQGLGVLPPLEAIRSRIGTILSSLLVFGTFCLVLYQGWRGVAVVTTLIGLLAVVTLYYRSQLGIQTLADRSWLHLLLVAAIGEAYGIAMLRRSLGWALAKLYKPIEFGSYLTVALLVSFVMFNGINKNRGEFFYQLIDDRGVSDFVWVRDNLTPEIRRTLLRPDVAFSYRAITRGYPYSMQAFPFSDAGVEASYRFLYAGNGSPPEDMNWLIDAGVSLVYAPHWDSGGQLFDEPRPGVFLLSTIR